MGKYPNSKVSMDIYPIFPIIKEEIRRKKLT
jgi:hypothetical protein